MKKRPIGIVRFRLFRRGRLLWEIEARNLFVDAGRPALAALLGGDTAGEFAAAIGFGSGAAAATTGDIGLTAPAYYKTLDSHTEDGAGSVTFNWSLKAADVGAQGITIQELGLFANTGSVALPGALAPAPLLARRTITPIAFAAGMNITGSWTISF